jgi:hypothetical protein
MNKAPAENKLATPENIKALRRKTQLRIDDSLTGVNRVHTHGVGLWGNPRVVFGVRVDKGLKKQFTLASQALFGSTCNPVECFMATIVGMAKHQENFRVNPSLTINGLEIKIERNLRERRKISNEEAKINETSKLESCSIPKCGRPAVEIMIYQPKGKTPKEYLVCLIHSTEYTKSPVWSSKKKQDFSEVQK